MAYAKPELLNVGSAEAIVLGTFKRNPTDNVVHTITTVGDLVLGLDD